MTQSVLCAIDVTHPEDTEVLKQADKMARMDDAALDVVTVVPNLGVTLVASYFDEHFQDQLVTETKKKLSDFVSAVLGEDRNKAIRHIVATGSVYEEILQVAKQVESDLIVIGARKPHLKEFLLGPNAARVVRHADQSVMVVRT